MKFMLMMNAPRGKGDGGSAVVNWAPQDFKAHIDFMKTFAKKLQQAGEWVDGQGLAEPGQARSCARGRTARPKSLTDRSPKRRSSSPATGSWTSIQGARVCDRGGSVSRAWTGRQAD